MPSLAPKLRLSLLGVMLAGPAFGPASAQDGASHPLDSALESMDLKTEAGPMPDFVTQSRGTGTGDYIPVGAKPPARGLKPKSAADVKALTAELDAARDAQRAGRRPKPMGSGAPSPRPSGKAAGKPLDLKRGAAEATNR